MQQQHCLESDSKPSFRCEQVMYKTIITIASIIKTEPFINKGSHPMNTKKFITLG